MSVDFAAGDLVGAEYHGVLAELRERGPVVEVRFGDQPAWMITRYAELAAAFRDTQRFPPGEAYRRTTEPTVGRSFISMSGAEHRLFRTLATPAFRSRAVAGYERSGLAELAQELLDEIPSGVQFDLVPSFIQRLPILMICRLLGLPRDAEARYQDWALGLLSFPFDPEHALRCSEEFTRHIAPLVRERRRSPRPDVISELIAAEVEGRRLSDEEILSHIRLLFPTGAETTYNALGSLIYALLDHGLWQRLIDRRAERQWAIEELLRWENPVAIVPRVAADAPISFGGAEIPPGAPVLFGIASAQRDPGVFADPDRFDVDRHPEGLLSFGPGARTCPGMHLARKELAVALDALLQSFPELHLIDPEAAQPVGTVLRGPRSLVVST